MLSVLALLAPLLAAVAPAQAAPEPSAPGPVSSQAMGADRLAVYSGVIAPAQVGALTDLGLDRRELDLSATADGAGLRVKIILSGRQAEGLAAEGILLEAATASGQESGDARADTLAEPQESVFQRYSGAGGLQEEMTQQVAEHPRLTKLVTIGTTVAGQDIVGVKVGLNAARTPDGAKPTTVYLGAQHAREWITPRW